MPMAASAGSGAPTRSRKCAARSWKRREDARGARWWQRQAFDRSRDVRGEPRRITELEAAREAGYRRSEMRSRSAHTVVDGRKISKRLEANGCPGLSGIETQSDDLHLASALRRFNVGIARSLVLIELDFDEMQPRCIELTDPSRLVHDNTRQEIDRQHV